MTFFVKPEDLKGVLLDYTVAEGIGMVRSGGLFFDRDGLFTKTESGERVVWHPAGDAEMILTMMHDFDIDLKKVGIKQWRAKTDGAYADSEDIREAVIHCFVRLRFPQGIEIPNIILELLGMAN